MADVEQNTVTLRPETTRRSAFEVWLEGDRALFSDRAGAIWEARDYHRGPARTSIAGDLQRSLNSTDEVDAHARMLLDATMPLEEWTTSYLLGDEGATARAFIPRNPLSGIPGAFRFAFGRTTDRRRDSATIEREFVARQRLDFAAAELGEPPRARNAYLFQAGRLVFTDAIGQRWWVQDIAYSASKHHRGKRRDVPFGDKLASAREFRPMGRVDRVRFCDLESAGDRAIGEDVFARQLEVARLRSVPPLSADQG